MRKFRRALIKALSAIYIQGILPLLRLLPLNTVKGRRSSLSEWAKRTGEHSVKEILAAETIEKRLPDIAIPNPPKQFIKAQVHTNPPITVTELANARIATRYCDVISPDGYIFEDIINTVAPEDQRDVGMARSQLLPMLPKPEIKRGTYATINVYWGMHNYWHWIMDCLSRLWALEAGGYTDYKLIVPSPMSRYQQELLELLGFPKERWEPFEDGHWQIERLLVPSLTRVVPQSPTQAVNWMRERFLNAVPESSEALPKRLFVSRLVTDRRRLLNEDEIFALFEPHGFVKIANETMGVREQIQLYRQAEVIAGLHGAGFTNLMFMPTGGLLIEFLNSRREKQEYWSLANVLGMRYACVTTEGYPETGKPPFRDIWIDPERVKQVLEQLFVSEPAS